MSSNQFTIKEHATSRIAHINNTSIFNKCRQNGLANRIPWVYRQGYIFDDSIIDLDEVYVFIVVRNIYFTSHFQQLWPAYRC